MLYTKTILEKSIEDTNKLFFEACNALSKLYESEDIGVEDRETIGKMIDDVGAMRCRAIDEIKATLGKLE